MYSTGCFGFLGGDLDLLLSFDLDLDLDRGLNIPGKPGLLGEGDLDFDLPFLFGEGVLDFDLPNNPFLLGEADRDRDLDLDRDLDRDLDLLGFKVPDPLFFVNKPRFFDLDLDLDFLLLLFFLFPLPSMGSIALAV